MQHSKPDLLADTLNQEGCHAADKHCCMAACWHFTNDGLEANASNVSLLFFLPRNYPLTEAFCDVLQPGICYFA